MMSGGPPTTSVCSKNSLWRLCNEANATAIVGSAIVNICVFEFGSQSVRLEFYCESVKDSNPRVTLVMSDNAHSDLRTSVAHRSLSPIVPTQ